MVTTTTPRGQRVSICTCTRTGLATLTCRPGSSLYTLTTEPPQVAATGQVSMSDPVAAPCSCRLLSHQTLLWHHRIGHPSLPCLYGMHSRLLVFGLHRSLPPLPPSPAPPCLPCLEGGQRAAPHSSSFPSMTTPLQTLHMDVKGEVPDVLIPWIRAVLLQLRERFCKDLPVLLLHSDGGGEFSSDLLRDSYPLPLAEPVEVTIYSGAAGGGAARGVAYGGAELAGGELGGAESSSAKPRGAEPVGAEPGGAETEGAEPGGAESKGAESRGAEPRGTASAGGPAGASPRHSRQPEPLSPWQLREWFAQRTCLRSGAAGAGGSAAGGTGAGGVGATSPGGAGVNAGARGT
ncbi:unnamed protein product [Closterium sp. NIES-54]